MSCFHPLFAISQGKDEHGKHIIVWPDQARLELFKRDEILKERLLLLPCGKCIGCRLDRARQWADRCMLELQYHDSAYFVTLTYNDQHVPKSYYADPDTGEAQPVLTLCRRDVQLFLKRLRKAFPDDKIRYYGCAEYGPNTYRPHYHIILFGLHLNDLQLKRQDMNGKPHAYFSPSLQAAWSVRPFGNKSPILDKIGDVECSDVTWSACNYTARYIVNKQLGPDGQKFYETFNIVPPFTFMSTHPGIGRQYYDDHEDQIYKFDSMAISTPTGGRSIRPSHYYDRLYDIEHSDELSEIKSIRKYMAEQSQRIALSRTSMSDEDYLALCERVVADKAPKHFDI